MEEGQTAFSLAAWLCIHYAEDLSPPCLVAAYNSPFWKSSFPCTSSCDRDSVDPTFCITTHQIPKQPHKGSNDLFKLSWV